MNRLDSMHEALSETSVAAVTYQVGENDVARLEPLARQMASRDGWELAGLQRALLGIAAEHFAEHHGRTDCRTCRSIGFALASTLAAVRVLVEREQAAVTHDHVRPSRV